MNPFQVVGMITFCTVVFGIVVVTLVLHGIPLLLAFLSVYGVVFFWMQGMQRRACQSLEGNERQSNESMAYPVLDGDAVSSVR